MDYTTNNGSLNIKDDNRNTDLDKSINLDISDSYSIFGSFINETESTSDVDIRKADITYLNALLNISDKVVYLILHSHFEDGMTNPAIETVRDIFYRRPFIAASWICMIFSSNQDNDRIISGLLRIIATFDKSYSSIFIPIVRSGLSDKSPLTQEAAIMVIEEWRTEECLSALECTNLASQWIKEYAESVIDELKEELIRYAN